MTGTLGLFSLVDLFQLLASSSRTGRLGVDHPAGTARVYFDKGRVVHAEFGELVGEEAVYALFADERGSFEFTVGLPAPEVSVQGGTENLLLEAIRRVDEARRTRADERDDIPPGAVPVFVEDAPNAGSLTLQAQEVLVLRLVDGHRTVQQVGIEAGLKADEARAVVKRLVEIGALRLRGRRPRTARLVTQLSRMRLEEGSAGIDPNILASWEKVLGHPTDRVACRMPDGRVQTFSSSPVEGAGPFILFTRDTLFRADLAVNEALLVKPVATSE